MVYFVCCDSEVVKKSLGLTVRLSSVNFVLFHQSGERERMIKLMTAILVGIMISISQVEARPSDYYTSADRHAVSGYQYYSALPGQRVHQHKARGQQKYQRKPRIIQGKSVKAAVRHTRTTPVILAHPAGCPRTRFCGCGASIKVFGKSIRSLWLAKNWFQFPASTPGPGKVAVRVGHVFVIIRNLGGGKVLAYDANSGGHKTRIHVRSLAGYSVRDPKIAIKIALR